MVQFFAVTILTGIPSKDLHFFFSYMAVYSRLQAPHRPLILIRFILLNKLYICFILSLFNIFIKQKNTMKKYFFACDESHPLESDSCAH